MQNKQLFGNVKPDNKMKELVDELNEASNAYYNGHDEIMSNKEFDDKLAQLAEMEDEQGYVLPDSPTHQVGYEAVDSLPKFKHPYPALSLDKTKDINKFVKEFEKGIAASGSINHFVVLMYKEDGSTVQAYYKKGKLDKLVTRGNGEIGSVITHNANILDGLPLTLPYECDLVVRGEAVMSYKEFERINSELPQDAQYANPRNLAAATLTMLDSSEASKRHLRFQAFKLVDAKIDSLPVFHSWWSEAAFNISFSYRLNMLESKCGFNVVPFKIVNVSELLQAIKEMTDDVADYEYPVDGLVAAMDDYEYTKKLVGTEHHCNIMEGYAFKWADESAETVLREIEWSPSRTGLLNPVAIFDPVELEGTTVSRASLHNLSIMRKMRIHVGNRLSVYKANKIIPYVDRNLDYDTEADYDDNFIQELIGCCPTCGAAAVVMFSPVTGIESVHCPNAECPEKLIGNFVNFCSRDAMDIQGMSEETIKKLVDNGFITEYADFYKLDSKPEIAQLPGFGQISWQNMCRAAEESKNSCTFIRFLVALNIPDIGKGQAKILYNYIMNNYSYLCDLVGADADKKPTAIMLLRLMLYFKFDFTAIDGFGSILARRLTTWLQNHLAAGADSPEIHVLDMMSFNDIVQTKTVSSPVAGKAFCITGSLIHFANRQELVAKIESLGGKWVDSVSKKTDYLINNDVTSTSGKNKKAAELNIPIISEADFLSMVE